MPASAWFGWALPLWPSWRPIGCWPANRPGLTRDLSSPRLGLPIECAPERATTVPTAAVQRPPSDPVTLWRFPPHWQHGRSGLGYPSLRSGWRIFQIRPGRRQGISPSWRLIGPSWLRPCFRPQPPAGFPFRALLRRPSHRPFRTSSFLALSSPKATLTSEAQGRIAPQSLAPGRQLYGLGRLLNRRAPQCSPGIRTSEVFLFSALCPRWRAILLAALKRPGRSPNAPGSREYWERKT